MNISGWLVAIRKELVKDAQDEELEAPETSGRGTAYDPDTSLLVLAPVNHAVYY